MSDESKLTEHDVDILRRLAEHKAEIAQDPVKLGRWIHARIFP